MTRLQAPRKPAPLGAGEELYLVQHDLPRLLAWHAAKRDYLLHLHRPGDNPATWCQAEALREDIRAHYAGVFAQLRYWNRKLTKVSV